MPTLQFKGKTFVQNHHLAVPFHQLVPQPDKSLTDKVSLNDNLIIHGDNLTALKALLPTYAGKVKCIYIDPPYNTGNEGWVYNDNVKSPLIKEWIGQVVGKEGEDLVRHDKWLCMMMPRLKLLRELLSDEGLIFISIDDTEVHHLKLLLNEIFGEQNFRGQVSRLTGTPTGAGAGGLMNEFDYILIYSKSDKASLDGIEFSEDDAKIYNLSDSNGEYLIRPLRKTGGEDRRADRPTMYFPIISPDGSEVYPFGPGGYESRWRCSPEKYKKLNEQGLIEWKQGKNGWTPYLKFYLEGRTRRPSNLWKDIEGNKKASRHLSDIFESKVFDTPKPVELVTRIINIATSDGDIVLDSFAGSGTTAEAVLLHNVENDESRKFILVECEDYADTITAERVRRVIKGVPTAKNEWVKKGLGGSFSYFDLGDAIEMESLLAGKSLPNYADLARYLFYTATGEEFKPDALDESSNYVGKTDQFDVYMYYKPDLEYLKTTALTLDTARALREKAGSRPLIVFAPTKYVEQQTLDELNITFCQLPFEIYRLKN